MADGGPILLMLDANNPNTTNTSVPSNSTEIPGGINGYIETKYVIIVGGIFLATTIVGILLFTMYRKRAHRKEREAGNVNVAISRPNPK